MQSKEMVVRQVEEEKPGFELLARRLEIINQEQYEAAANLLKEVKHFQKVVEADQRPVCDAAHKAWKTALATMQAHLEPAQSAERIIKAKMGTYIEEQERIARAERARLLAEAEAKARAEREAQVQASLAAAAQAEKERDEITAAMAMSEAEELEATPIVPIIETRVKPVAKVAGIASRVGYDFTVVSFAELPDEYKIADDKKIRAVIKAHKGQITIPGVKINQERIIASR